MRAVVRVGWLLLLGGLTGCRREPAPLAPASEPAAEAPEQEALEPLELPCVHFNDLKRFLPSAVAGRPALREGGSTGKYGEISVSEAERIYALEDGREVKVRIVDTTLARGLSERIRTVASAAEEALRQARLTRSLEPVGGPLPLAIGDSVGFMRYDADAERAEANLLVADRFVVAVVTRGYQGTGEVQRLAGTLDLDGLALLR